MPRLAEAVEGERVVLFMDAAHFVFATFLGYLWSRGRRFLSSHAGRSRFNVLGAINAVGKKVTVFTNDSYINSKSVCCLLKKLYLEYYGQKVTIVLDNARCQRCKLVIRYARVLGIELLFLPSYSPNLNLIERFWKLVRKKVLYSKFYTSFDQFKLQITDFIDNAEKNNREELESLLSFKFQSFKNIKI